MIREGNNRSANTKDHGWMNLTMCVSYGGWFLIV